MRHVVVLLAATALAACGGDDGPGNVITPTPSPAPPTPAPSPTSTVQSATVATFDSPWAMTFLPDGQMLVTETAGVLRLVTQAGAKSTITGVPAVADAGQGGLLDIALDPSYAANRRVYLSFAEAGAGGSAGLAVARATLTLDGSGSGGRLDNLTVIWRQAPKVVDTRHFGARMAFSPDGFLFVTAGERHQGAPAQDLAQTLGKIIRINPDGTIPSGNPFATTAGAKTEVWTLGHRNPYGLVFAQDGRLFESEMGPDAGDEFNIVTRGANYGWRVVSEGSDGGEALPRHATRPEFAAPAYAWTPNIAPAGMIQYTGTRFVGWNGDLVLAGLVQQGLVRVRVSGSTASEVARIPLAARIREVEQGPDGAIWVLEDGAGARLRKLTPA